MKWTEVDTAEREQHRGSSSTRRCAGSKLGKGLSEDTCAWWARRSQKRCVEAAAEDGGILPREEGVDPVIKITHSAVLHSTGKLIDGTCSITVSSAYLGVLGGGAGGSHTYTFIRVTQIKTSTAWDAHVFRCLSAATLTFSLPNRQRISTALSNDPSWLLGMLLKNNRQPDGIAYPYCLIHAPQLFGTQWKHSCGV